MKPKPALHLRGCSRLLTAKQPPSWPDVQFTACREWLEGPDRPPDRLAAHFVLVLSAVYLTAQLAIRLWRGG